VLLLVVMLALVVALDALFRWNRFGLRLAVNVGIVAVAAAAYSAFLRK
jgi:hypothetical protein